MNMNSTKETYSTIRLHFTVLYPVIIGMKNIESTGE